MKVLMTTDTIGGVWTFSIELAGALRHRGVEVALATMGPEPDHEQRRAAEAHGIELHPSTFKLEWMDDPWADVRRAGDWLLELEERTEPDLAHLNGYAHAALPWRAPVLAVAHSCVLSWWRAVKGDTAPAEWNTYREVVGRGLRAADTVVAPTRAMLREAERCYGPLGRCGVIPNGRSAALFPPDRKRSFIFSAGRLWDEAKNVRALEAAADRVTWPIYVAGSSGEPVRGEAAAGQAQPAPHRLGQLPADAVADWLGRASIYALPARYEPFGLSALEAALAGCALVLGDIPSLREVWEEDAAYVDPDDPASLASTLNVFIRDERQRERLARRAAHRARRRFTPRRMADRYLDHYHRLLELDQPDTRRSVA